MKHIIKAEELAMAIITIYLATLLQLPINGWIYFIAFFSPDISIPAYAINNKAGAMVYNIFHHKGIALIIALIGLLLNSEYIIFAGLMLLAHSSFDRLMGYGLKYFTGFRYTHLGNIGKK